MLFTLRRSNLYIAFCCFIYKFVSDIFYLNYISPRWSYMGLVSDFSLSKTVVSYILTAIVFCFLKWNNNKIGNVILQYLFIVMLIPLLSFWALANKQTDFLLFCVAGFNLTVLLVNRFDNSRVYLNFLYFKRMKSFYLYITILLFFVIVYMINYYGVHIATANMFDSEAVYSIRRDQTGVGGFIKYLIAWSYKVICPLLISFSLSKNCKTKVVFYCCLQIIMYLCTPHKEIILSMGLLFCTYYCYKKGILQYFWYYMLTGFMLLGILFEELFNTRLIYIEALIYRLLFLPAAVKFEHYTYFSQHEKLFFSEGLLGKLFGREYFYGKLTSGQVVSNYFYNNNNNANTGYLAYSYDDIGFAGIIIASVLLGILIIVLQSALSEKNVLFILPPSVYIFGQLNDGPLLTAMLTGGILVLLTTVFIIELKSKKIRPTH